MRVSLLQMNSGGDKEGNFSKSMLLAEKALRDNPDVICLSERFLYWGDEKTEESEDVNSKFIVGFRKFAKKNNVNVILGSVALKSEEDDKVTNTTFVINKRGEVVFRYDKVYMFNVNKEDIVVRESDSTIAGDSLGVFSLDGVKMGVGICYDLRYPEYFQALVKEGVEIVFLPSNFRKKTGTIAWENLTCARAIENQVYFCACNQTGESGIKERCGNTRVISYEGVVLENLESEEGVVFADLDLEKMRKFRKEFPVLEQIKVF